uniref:Uncharacterized protein n=1 Tax=Glossina austeni TaxID=7395 RepID=A0A1A9UI13_GLOAU
MQETKIREVGKNEHETDKIVVRTSMRTLNTHEDRCRNRRIRPYPNIFISLYDTCKPDLRLTVVTVYKFEKALFIFSLLGLEAWRSNGFEKSAKSHTAYRNCGMKKLFTRCFISTISARHNVDWNKILIKKSLLYVLSHLSVVKSRDLPYVGTCALLCIFSMGHLLVCWFAHNSKAYDSSCWYCPQTIESFAAFAVSNLSLRLKLFRQESNSVVEYYYYIIMITPTETTTIATTSEMKNIEK